MDTSTHLYERLQRLLVSLHLGHAPWACISLGRLGCSLLARESLYRVLETVYEGASASYLDD